MMEGATFAKRYTILVVAVMSLSIRSLDITETIRCQLFLDSGKGKESKATSFGRISMAVCCWYYLPRLCKSEIIEVKLK
jgi:hypothetical protein